MFGIGAQDIVIIGLLCLAIIGPSNLPRMARDLGRFVNEARLQLEVFKAEIYSTEEEDKQNSRRSK